MSCITNHDDEPEFEPVKPQNRMLAKLPIAHSSPKLRLTFDDQDDFMTETDVENIIHQDRILDFNPESRSSSQHSLGRPRLGVYGKEKGIATEKRKIRPNSVIPRFGTLTALPGSSMVVENQSVSSAGMGPKTPTNLTMRPPARPASSTFVGSVNPSHKRKLSLTAPLLKNVKRILTPSKIQNKPSIMHLTHEATASNRAIGGICVDGGNDKSIRTLSEGMSDTRRLTSDMSDMALETPRRGRDLAAPVFAGPSSVYSDTGIESSTNAHQRTASKSTAARLFEPLHLHRHRRNISTTSTIVEPDPTSKAELNKLIIALRTQVSDLTLENRVLKDQIAIVRKDWVDASRELDVERHRVWENEMQVFKLKLRNEELLTEVGRLKRGSVFTFAGDDKINGGGR